MLERLQVQHELRERAVQPRRRAAQEGEARARELDAHLKVQPQWHTNVHMVFDFKGHGCGRTPAAHFNIAVLVRTHRHALVRQVG